MVYNYLIFDLDGWTVLHTESHRGNVEVIKVLLAKENIEVNRQDVKGCTPLHLAIMEKQTTCVQV